MLAINAVIETHNKGVSTLYRIVDFLDSYSTILFELPSPKGPAGDPPLKLKAILTKHLENSILDGSMKLLTNDPFIPHITPPNYSSDENNPIETKDDRRRDRADAAISWIVEDGYKYLLPERSRAARLRKATSKFGHKYKTLTRWLVRYLTYGMTPNSLYPLHHNKGLRGQPKPMGENKRGRPTKFRIGGGCNVSKEMRELIQAHALKRRAKGYISEPALYAEFRDLYCVDGVEIHPDGSTSTALLPQERRIKEATYIKYLRDDQDLEKMSRAIHGNKHDVNHRETTGSETARSLFAGEILQIDFTILDVQAVHPVYRHNIGRPLGGFGCDVHTLFQAGLHLTMANTSALQAMLLLENIFSAKVDFCRRLGITIKPEDWPGGFLWHKLYTDNGELRGMMSNCIPKNLRIRFTNTVPYRPDQKGSIESSINHVTSHEIKLLPGYVPRQRERGDKPCSLDGKLDPFAITKILALASMHRNEDWIRDHHLTLQAEKDRVAPRPLDLWRHSIENNLGPLRKAPEPDLLRLLTLPRATAEITGDGLVFKDLYYTSSQLRLSQAFQPSPSLLLPQYWSIRHQNPNPVAHRSSPYFKALQ
jgi:hypothetical protein